MSSKPPSIRTCRLCLAETELCFSHILPEFLYEPFYDDKHKFVTITLDGSSSPPTRIEQKGLREYLLCRSCETLLSGLETYAVDHYFRNPASFFMHLSDGRGRPLSGAPPIGVEYRGLDYAKMKLFQLSLLWRVSVATIKFFHHVSVGTEHEERLRSMILTGDPGQANAYPCLVTEDPSIKRGDLLSGPLIHSIGPERRQDIVTLIVDRQIWQYEVTPAASVEGPSSSLAKMWIGHDGLLRSHIRDIRQTPFWAQLQSEVRGWSDDVWQKIERTESKSS